MYGKTALKAYKQGPQHGKFNSLYGTGDHPSEGGKIVEGVSGKIHIRGDNVEDAIMKAHPKEGEYILAQRKGYSSPSEAPVDENTGYRKYGDDDPDFWARATERQTRLHPGEAPEGTWNTIQSLFGWGEYSEDELGQAEIERRLGTMLETGFESLQAGSDKMLGSEGFIQQQLGEQLLQLGEQSTMYDIQEKGLDIKEDQLAGQTTNVQRSMRQYGGARDIQKKTGLIGDQTLALEDIEFAGKTGMTDVGYGYKNVALGRETIGSQRNVLASKMRGAETSAEMQEFQYQTQTEQAMAKMMTDYMSATGEDVPEEFYTLFEDYSEQFV